MPTDIHEQLKQAITARKGTLQALRERIAELLAPIPIGVHLADDAGEVCRVARISTGASQWSNRKWLITIKGRGYLTEAGKLLADEIDSSYHDGNNCHYRTSEPLVLGVSEWGDEGKPGLKYEPGTRTRELAARLPAAIARYMQECAAEADKNTATTEAL